MSECSTCSQYLSPEDIIRSSVRCSADGKISALGALLNQNEAPTDIALSTTSINENNSIGDIIGAFSTTDPDAGDTFVYTLVAGTGSTDNASFIIDGANLKAGAAFDYETKSSYAIRVRSTDSGGLYTEKQFTITINNVTEAPGVTSPTSTGITNAQATVGATLDCKGLSTVWSIEYGTTNAYGSTQAGGTTTANGAKTVNLTGLSQFTTIYWRFKAVNSDGTTYSPEQTFTTLFYATLTATGTGAGVSTLALTVSENQTIEIISGNARFYTDAGGTTGESTTWAVTTGALRTIYLKAASSTSILNIPNAGSVTTIGNSGNAGWVSSTNAPSLAIDVSKLNLTQIRITGTSVLSGSFKNALTYMLANGDGIQWDYSGSMSTALTSLYLNSTAMNMTSLDFTGSGNITSFSMLNYRNAKMSSADMITLLTSLTNRAGTMPATITINDYADYASPPAGVVTAVNALKAAKSITTVNLGA